MPTIKLQELKILEKRPAINFTNTIDWRGKEPPSDYLNNYSDLIDWGGYAGLLNEIQVRELKKKAEESPEKAAKAYEEAIRFREASYRIINQISKGQKIDPTDKEILDHETRAMLSHLTLNLESKQLELQGELGLNYLLMLLVKDMVDLLTSDELPRVKRCSSDECGWLFIDTSKNNSRKWCQMRACGNRAKARRYYSRQQQ
ncbi:MAG: CGNR zinc finger domain-containing protein [bacterium]